MFVNFNTIIICLIMILEFLILVYKRKQLIMYKKVTHSTNAEASKRKSQKILTKETENGQHSLVGSLHKWGEDYYGAEDYYEKPVNNIKNEIHYNDFRKKADKQ